MEQKEFLNSNRTVIMYFIKLVKRLTPGYIPTLILQSLVKTLKPLIFILGPKLIVDELMAQSRTEVLIAIIGFIAGGNFLLSLIEKVVLCHADSLAATFENAFERHISEKTVDIDYENVEDPDVLNLKERALFAVRNHGLMYVMIEAMSKVVNEAVLIIGLSLVIWTFSVWVLVLLVAMVVINSFLFKKIQKYYYIESTQTVGSNRAFVYYIGQSSDLEIAKDIRLYNMADMVIDKMNRFNLNIYKLYLKIYGSISRLNGLISINAQIQTVIIYMILAIRTMKGMVTIGNFMMYAGAVGKFSNSMNTLVSSVIEVNRLCRQLELLVEYEKIPASSKTGSTPMPDAKAFELECHNVSFKYPRASEYTLKNVSVKIKAGEKISIIGCNGAGKTTFVKLITRLYKPTEGTITLNGIDIQTLDYEAYMSQIAAVFQDYRLLGVTLEENITKGEASNEKNLTRILKDVGALEDVMSLPQQLGTPLDKSYDKSATKLSGGQAQKIAIARAVYKDAAIVILDEPTAALDPIAEHDVYCRFDELVEGKTAIYISHRLSSCKFCDRVLVFEKGTIVQIGSHEDLIKEKGAQYETLFSAQAVYYT